MMHRATQPGCQCSSLIYMQDFCNHCPFETEDILDRPARFLHPPTVVKAFAVRPTRGHRNWMTHLPLSRPRESATAI